MGGRGEGFAAIVVAEVMVIVWEQLPTGLMLPLASVSVAVAVKVPPELYICDCKTLTALEPIPPEEVMLCVWPSPKLKFTELIVELLLLPLTVKLRL